MSLFRSLGESSAGSPLASAVTSLVDTEIADSWTRVPEAWKSTITQKQVEDFLEGVAAKVIRQQPTAPARELTIYLLGKAASMLTGGGSGNGDGGIDPEGLVVSPDANNRLEQRINGLYVRDDLTPDPLAYYIIAKT